MAGTVPVAGPLGADKYQYELEAVGRWVYYGQYEGSQGGLSWRLYRTDGTAAGTTVVHP